MLNENALIDSTLKGNSSDFGILIEKYKCTVSSFIYNMTMDKAASEDIAQETFINAYKKLYTFNHKSKFSTWLLVIAKNKTIDYLRKNKKYTNINDSILMNIHDDKISPEEHVEFNELKSNALSFISQLNDIDRKILSLKYVSDNITFYDIAAILNISEQAARQRFHRIKCRFKEICLKGEETNEV